MSEEEDVRDSETLAGLDAKIPGGKYDFEVIKQDK